MELRVSSQKTTLLSSECASDPDEKEISEGEDEDDDRNHKHRRQETHSQSLEGDSFTRPYRKGNKPFEYRYSYRDGDPQSGDTWKNYNLPSERHFPSRFEKKRSNQSPFSRSPLDLNQRIRGNQMIPGDTGAARGRGRDPFLWGPHDSRLGLVDVTSQLVQPGPVPSGMFAGRGLPNVSNAHSIPWNTFGLVPGVPNGGFDALHLGIHGALGPGIGPPMNMGIPRQRCRDFEERGFCLRGDMCPMEHGVNRIVVEDVQSLSQFNLPVSVPGSQQGALPVISSSSGSLMNSKALHAKSSKPGMTQDGMGLNGGVGGGSMVGVSDVYDPDQPLWANGNPETSAAFLALNQSNADEKDSSLDLDPSDQQNIEPYVELDDERPARTATPAGSQNASVWGRINSFKHRLGQKEKNNSVGTSSYAERDIKSEEALQTGLPSVSHQGKLTSVDNELSLKPHNDSIHNIQKPSHKAVRTLFVNGIPLKDSRKEALLSHFQKFGEVIDVYIPMHGERAFVQFSKREEAEAALKAPDAIMGNRFIKLWWANRDNIPDDGIGSSSNVSINPLGMALNPGLSHSFVPEKGKGNPHHSGGENKNGLAYVAQMPVHDHPKPMVANGPKAPLLQQKKLESLELLKEELRKKREMLDQKRNEFKRQLDKLEKQSTGSKDIVTVPEQATKRLKVEAPTDNTKVESSEASPRATLSTETTRSSEQGVTHASTSNPMRAGQEPLRPSIRPLVPLGIPFVVNRFKLDNRSRAFRILPPLPAGLAEVATLEEHFSTYGDLSSVELEEPEPQETTHASVPPNVSACVSFTTRRSAEKAFSHGKCWQGQNLQFMWVTAINSCKESGGSKIPSASSNKPSDSREAASTHSQTNASLKCDEPENFKKESDVESVEPENDSKSNSSEKHLP
ncbi:hypothetical protein RD792_016591 [Penstemon davidsonii]|uniref:Zinc finger CCCH domain-containing protein 41 n=1 Tax=Penstemon davidsonii TaxID=160366 RepID=A0ABR0CKZ7_9LAMI|nr:hypothetical protein RD792_016591 [Penstemon davidsonii]